MQDSLEEERQVQGKLRKKSDSSSANAGKQKSNKKVLQSVY